VVKILYVISILSLICAGLLFGVSGVQLLQGVPQDEHNPGMSVTERLLTFQGPNGNSDQSSNPLLEQAAAFALYLSPPKPPPSPPMTQQSANIAGPAPRPPSPTPQFRLLAISYYRANPDMSLAMVWDASKGGYWIRKGDRLGHFVIERIEKDAIFYRDGDQLRQMAMTIKEPAQLARLRSKESASSQNVAANEIVVSASK